MICPHCKVHLSNDAKSYCPNCGEPLKNILFQENEEKNGSNSIKENSQKGNDPAESCDEQMSSLESYGENSRPTPSLTDDQSDELKGQAAHYNEMLRLDSVIAKEAEAAASGTSLEDFYAHCKQQQIYIDLCKKNKWAVPKISILKPLELYDSIASDGNKMVRKSRFIGVSLFLVIVATIVAVSYFVSIQGKVQMPFDSSAIYEKDIDTLCEELRRAGFKNISTKVSSKGWKKEGEVVDVSADGATLFEMGSYYEPDAEVVIYYSSGDREDATQLFEGWAERYADDLIQELFSFGFTEIYIRKTDTDELEKNNRIVSISFDGMTYSDGPCYLPLSTEILITYYNLKITMKAASSKFIDSDYGDVVSALTRMGFTNIELQRANNLMLGILKKEGTVYDISINGNSEFSKDDVFEYDSPIIIIVNTFENYGCDDITIVSYQ